MGGEAGLLAETVGLEGRGFEVCRRLYAKYAPTTRGQFEIDTLIHPKPAKDFTSLPGAIAKFEHDFRQYEKRSGEVFPEKYKVASLVQIMPETQATDLNWRFANGLSNYTAMVEQIEQYGQFHRHEAAYSRGEADDRMVDTLALAHEQWLSEASGAEVAAYYEGLSAGLAPDCQAAVEPEPNDEPFDALSKKGKGKGKGKRGGKGNGGPASSGGQGASYGGGQGGGKAGDGKGKETRTCNHCLIKGHIERDCRKTFAGEPAKSRPARSLEQGQQQLDQLNGQDWSRQRTGVSGLSTGPATPSTSSLTPTSSSRTSGSQRSSARRRHRPQRLRQHGPRPLSQGPYSSRLTSRRNQSLRLTLGPRHRLTLGPDRPQCSPRPPRLSPTASPRRALSLRGRTPISWPRGWMWHFCSSSLHRRGVREVALHPLTRQAQPKLLR